MQRIVCIIILFWTGTLWANEPPQVTNIRAVQRSDTTLVDITYDLADADGDTLFVRVAILDSAGVDTIHQAVTFSGDLGTGIHPGNGKKITWNVGKDLPNTFKKYVAFISATDGPATPPIDPGSGGTPGPTLTTTLPGGAQMDFVYISPGTFTMGSPSNEVSRDSDEGPQHQVTVSSGFYLGKVEVTQAQWQAVMGTTPWNGQSYVQSNPNHPAVYVSWNDGQDFVHRLNVAAGDSLYRPPTEAEWEYACRAGTTTRWSFGDNESLLGNYAWYADNAWNVGEQYGHAVGTKLPNPWGLYDMHGNEWEWCQDWYGSYSSSAQVDPTGPSTGSSRVMRGGNFNNSAQNVRSANRNNNTPSNRNNNIGFRLLSTWQIARQDRFTDRSSAHKALSRAPSCADSVGQKRTARLRLVGLPNAGAGQY